MRATGSKPACLGAAAMLFATAAMAKSADPQVEALLAHMRSAYKQTTSVSATTVVTLSGTEFITTLSYLTGNRVRLSVTSPQRAKEGVILTVVSDGKTVSSKVLDRDYVQKPFTFDTLETDAPVNLETLCFFDWDRQLSTGAGKNMARSTFKISRNERWDNKPWTVLVETAAREKIICRYYIDPHTYLIWRTTVEPMPGGPKSSAADYKVTKMNLTAKIDPSVFEIVKL